MKEQKLFKAVSFIDEELISEAADYMPENNQKSDINGETVYISPVRVKNTRQIWKCSAAAAALLVAVGGTLFIANYKDGFKNNLDFPSDTKVSEERTEETENTVGTEQETDIADTAKPVEEPKTVVPLKVECLFDGDFGYFYYPAVVYVDSEPEIPQAGYSEEYFTEMTTKELLEYYGSFDNYNNLEHWIDSGLMVEVTDENTRHGIYTLPDGSVYDINTFTFERTENTLRSANKFTITIGKKSKFGQEYIDYFRTISEGKDRLYVSGARAVIYNEETDRFFSIYKWFGLSTMISGTTDEITNSFFAGDPETIEYGFYSSTDSGRVLICADMIGITAINIKHEDEHEPIHYFDRNVELWYNKENNSYLDEETFEWIPAEEWDFG